MTALSTLLTGYWLLVGSFSSSKDEGIRVYDFNPSTAEATYVSGLSGIGGPSFLCVAERSQASGSYQRVYAVGEAGGKGGSANYLRLDPRRGTLKLVGSQPSPGAGPCFIALAPDGRTVLTANYSGGSISAFPTSPDGRLLPGREIKFQGKSVHPERQTKPYLHSIFFSPDRRWMWCSDLGTDMIHAFPLDDEGTPLLSDSVRVSHFLRPGLGPRHLCFSADGETAYSLGELSDEVCTLRYMRDGSIRVFQVSPADSLHAGGSAHIQLSADGRFLYASHRLQGDGVSVFSVQPDGMLRRIAYQPVGSHPRHFALSPDERFLLVACAYDDVIQIYRRDEASGLLTDTGLRIPTPRPVCLVFVEKP
ncbi:MAG: lactonase family protein [Bacteroidaceae bacterium]|nr:lactonase family protein [Bacteroidaceae bacterium]